MEDQTQVVVTHASRLSRRKRHQLKCSVCHHPDRDAIEEAFLHWHSAALIKLEFQLPSRTSVYRHAHAFGLFARRSRKLRFALELIIEQAERVTPSANAIIHAVQSYTRLNDSGQWIDRPAHVIVSSGSARLAPKSARPGKGPKLGRRASKLRPRSSDLRPRTSNLRSSIGTRKY